MDTKAATPQNVKPRAPAPDHKKHKVKHALSHIFTVTIPKLLNYLVLILSLGLLAFISWDIYKGQSFLENTIYMEYQFWVCIIFIAEYLYRFIISKRKILFFFLAMPFLLICIPYMNLLNMAGMQVDEQIFSYLRFIPIIRGIFALVMVTAYFSRSLATNVFASYVAVLLPIIYMSSLLFYLAERNVNTAVKNIWYAFWWAGMNVTTIGCDINPMTATGMILALLLSLLGIIMLPLFTVYAGAVITDHNRRLKPTEKSLSSAS